MYFCRYIRATEAQLRIVHYKSNISLVDLYNYHDLYKAFDKYENTSIAQDELDANLIYFLARECKRHKFKKECFNKTNHHL